MNRHVSVASVKWDAPSVASTAFIAPSGLVLGDVAIGKSSSVWYNAIVKGLSASVTIGDNVNIQDSAYVGACGEFSPPVKIGNNVSIGHGAVLNGCVVHDHSLIGIGAVVSENCKVGPNSIVAAGAYVEEGVVVPSGEVWAGNPATKLRDMRPAEHDYLKSLPCRYVELATQHGQVMGMLKAKQAEFYA